MATKVSDKVMDDAIEDGVRIGGTKPTRETKMSWWDVYRYDGKLIAVASEGDWSIMAYEISEAELPSYTEQQNLWAWE